MDALREVPEEAEDGSERVPENEDYSAMKVQKALPAPSIRGEGCKWEDNALHVKGVVG